MKSIVNIDTPKDYGINCIVVVIINSLKICGYFRISMPEILKFLRFLNFSLWHRCLQLQVKTPNSKIPNSKIPNLIIYSLRIFPYEMFHMNCYFIKFKWKNWDNF